MSYVINKTSLIYIEHYCAGGKVISSLNGTNKIICDKEGGIFLVIINNFIRY